MKYIQTYINKEVITNGLKIESTDHKIIILNNEEVILYNCFTNGSTFQDAFNQAYLDDINKEDYTEYFNTSICRWIQLGILSIV